MIWAALAPYKLAAGLTLAAVAIASSGLAGYRLGSSLKQAQWDAQVVAEQKGRDAALKAAADAIARIEVKSETHIQPLRTEIRTNTVYRDCGHAADSVRNLNALIVGEQPGAGGMPTAHTPH